MGLELSDGGREQGRCRVRSGWGGGAGGHGKDSGAPALISCACGYICLSFSCLPSRAKKKSKPLNLKIHSTVGSCENIPSQQRSPLLSERSLRSFFVGHGPFLPSTPPVHSEANFSSSKLPPAPAGRTLSFLRCTGCKRSLLRAPRDASGGKGASWALRSLTGCCHWSLVPALSWLQVCRADRGKRARRVLKETETSFFSLLLLSGLATGLFFCCCCGQGFCDYVLSFPPTQANTQNHYISEVHLGSHWAECGLG